nr:MAG TPA: hypothetical protein [Caudoviricetes sp.]
MKGEAIMKIQNDEIFRSVFAMESAKLPLNMYFYTNAIMEMTEEDLNPSNYDNAKKKFIDLIEEPRLSVQRTPGDSNAPVMSVLRQNVTNTPKNPFEANEVICNFWDSVIPKDNPKFSTMYPKKCADFTMKLARDPDVACNNIESRNLGVLANTTSNALKLASSYDQSDFYPTGTDKLDVSPEDVIAKDNQETFDAVNNHMKESLSESVMEAYNNMILYIPFVESFSEKAKKIDESELCKYHDGVTPKLAVATYEAMIDGIISPFNASAIMESLNEISMNEFTVAAMLPMMGSTEGFDTVLAKTPIEKVVDKTNHEIGKDAVREDYLESAFEFLEYVADLYCEGVIDDDITNEVKKIVFEGFFDENEDYSIYDESRLKKVQEDLQKKTNIAQQFASEILKEYEKIENEVFKDYDEWKGMKLKDRAKEQINNAKSFVKGDKDNIRHRETNEQELMALMKRKCDEARDKKVTEYKNKYGIFIKGNYVNLPPFRDVMKKTGRLYLRGTDNGFDEELARVNKELHKREVQKPISNDKKPDAPKPVIQKKETKEKSSITAKDGKIVDISAYKKQKENGKKAKIVEFKARPTNKGNNALKESVELIGMMLLESGVETGSILSDIFESFYDASFDNVKTAYIEASNSEDESNVIFEAESKKVFDRLYQMLDVASKDKNKEFIKHMSSDKSKNIFHVKDADNLENKIPSMLVSLGYTKNKDIKKKKFFTKEVKNIIITAEINTGNKCILMSYSEKKEVTEFVSYEAANIDPDIKPILDILNRKGYHTKYSCSGHEKTRITNDRDRNGVYNGKLYTTARITFDKIYKLPSTPDRWRVSEKDGKTSIYSNPYSYGEHQGSPDEAFPKWKEMYMATLKSWAENLPEVGKKEDVVKESVTFDDIFYDTMQKLM